MNLKLQFFLTTISKTTRTVGIFVLSIVLARYFTKAEYGTYGQLQLIANTAVWAFLLGIPHSIYYFLPRVFEKRRFILTTMGTILGIAAASFCLVILFSDFIATQLNNPEIAEMATLLGLLILFQIPLTILEPLMISAKKVKLFVILELFINVSFFLAVLIPVLLGASLEQVITTLVTVYGIQALIVIISCIRLASMTIDVQDEHGVHYRFKDQIKYSAPIGMGSAAFELSQQADKYIVGSHATLDEFAEYTRGAMEIPIINIVANTIDNLLMPKFVESYARGDINSLIVNWHQVIRVMAAFIYPSCFFLVFVAPLLIPALFSDKYVNSVPIFQVYTLALLARISTYSVILRAIGQTKSMLWIILFGMSLNVGLTLMLIDLFGLIGAPIATVIATFIMSFAYVKAITGHLGMSMKQVFPWKSIGLTFINSAIAVMPLFLLAKINMGPWTAMGVYALVFTITYLISIKIFKSLTNDDLEGVRESLPSRLRWVV